MAHSYHGAEGIPDTQRGLWVTKVTFFVLVATAAAEGVIAWLSGSTALLADTVHAVSHAFTTLPLWIAFHLARRRPTSSYPYGYHRAEDLAGIVILVFIAISAALVGFESVRRLMDAEKPDHLPLALAAGVVGFLVNEGIAQYRVKVGKDIGSAALVADGHHARFDGLGSLAVVIGLVAVLIGYPVADPAVGLFITVLLVFLLVREAAPPVLSRVMDRIDPDILHHLSETAAAVPGVRITHRTRARWTGHRLTAELSISVDAGMTVYEGHRIAEQVQHALLHQVPKLQWCNIHVEPFQGGETATHQIISHHLVEEPGHEELHEGHDQHEPHQ